jgi:hypothetical protein
VRLDVQAVRQTEERVVLVRGFEVEDVVGVDPDGSDDRTFLFERCERGKCFSGRCIGCGERECDEG